LYDSTAADDVTLSQVSERAIIQHRMMARLLMVSNMDEVLLIKRK
jgi:hypothetical protein